ncbi:hypothetical protein AAZX31_08G142500 [Glycine max]|uniref:Uncharacterized protein n=1 Tax=Glycine max TaxID=3847 RepID=K7L6P9_SOYBN|nr:Type I inositol polyphosphate 5-phosphatase 5 [Glycine max]KAH1237167.1 Type I inositol polyphosphate 5-phosphatase 5 [Glycine max]KAH1237168.1 Type I inositol polyphosphate 5-phosphatase 5 [Glycine max]KRH43355.1 hypothetical protein GLYMA_08G144500v4 [Glycine max]
MSSFTGARSKANAKSEMIKANEINLCPINTSTITSTSPDTSAKNEKKKKSILPKIFGSKRNGRGSDEETLKSSSAEEGDGVTLDLENKIETRRKAFLEAAPIMRKSFSERETSPGIEGLNLSNFERPMMTMETELLRIFVAAWNVGVTKL